MNLINEPMVPNITIETEAQYVLEFPILVSVTLHNKTTDTDYLDIPELGLLFPLDSLAVDLQPINEGQPSRLGPTFTFRDRNLFRTELMAGQTKRSIIDLSQFGQSLIPGQYQLKVVIFNGPSISRASPPVTVEFIKPTEKEHAEASRLRQLGLRTHAADSGSWQPFLINNWNTVSVSQSVDERAFHQLALHLFLHRAAYGPESITQLSLDMLQQLQGNVLSAEAASFEYEIITTKGDKAERQNARYRLLQKWPDLQTQFDRIENSKGLLTLLKRGYGTEKGPPLPPGPHPYISTN